MVMNIPSEILDLKAKQALDRHDITTISQNALRLAGRLNAIESKLRMTIVDQKPVEAPVNTSKTVTALLISVNTSGLRDRIGEITKFGVPLNVIRTSPWKYINQVPYADYLVTYIVRDSRLLQSDGSPMGQKVLHPTPTVEKPVVDVKLNPATNKFEAVETKEAASPLLPFDSRAAPPTNEIDGELDDEADMCSAGCGPDVMKGSSYGS